MLLGIVFLFALVRPSTPPSRHIVMKKEDDPDEKEREESRFESLGMNLIGSGGTARERERERNEIG